MTDNFQDFTQHQQTIDYKIILFKVYRHWYLFVITIVVALAIAFLFNKYSKPIYEVEATVLVKDKSEYKMNPQDMIGLGFFNSMQNLQNEIGILQSWSLTYKALLNSGFEVSYFTIDQLITRELYKDAPFTVVFDTAVPQPVNIRFTVNILSGRQYQLSANYENVEFYSFSKREKVPGKIENVAFEKTYPFGEEVSNGQFRFRILLNPNFKPAIDTKYSYFFVFNDYEALVGEFRSFTIEPINREASILGIKLRGRNGQKLVDFANNLTNEYIARGLDRKNLATQRTVEFIEKELQGIADTLYSSEKALEVFRTNKEIMNLDDASKQVFDKMMELQDQMAILMVKSKYLNNLKEYIEKNKGLDELIVPSSMGVENDLLNDLTMQLTKLYTDRTELAQYTNSKNPSLNSLDLQIETTRNALYENIKSAINTNNIELKELNNRMGTFTSRINELPDTQRILFGMERRFKLTDAIYTYLLEKQSEARITQASNLPDNEVLDKAPHAGFAMVYPKKSLNYIIALILGLILPVLYVLAKDYFNDKIMEREDVEKITKLPVAGHIIHNDKPNKVVVVEYPKSTITESFRSVRTNVQYLLQGREKQVILITSDMVSAGKTFSSINLASVFALYGKKTLLLGFDLRKPKIFQEFGLTNTEGISSYLINKSPLDAIIQNSGIENFDIIMAGPIPPNPAELIASDKCTEFFTRLKERYDYIIIDTPPIGLVTDAFLLMKHSDVNIFLVRQGYTHKKIFASIIRDIELRKIPNMAILINDVKLRQVILRLRLWIRLRLRVWFRVRVRLWLRLLFR